LDDLRRSTLVGLAHKFNRSDGTISFGNGSRIICGHYQHENDIDAYLGLEYDVIAVEEATTLTEQKYRNVRTCCRSSKAGWRPRDYCTANPGGVGHQFFRKRFIIPYRGQRQAETRFVPSTCLDNRFNNPEYIKVLQSLTGWQRRAWLEGDWDIAAGQYFTNWREDVHVIDKWDDRRAAQWFCSFDFGWKHFTVCHLFAVCGDGVIVLVAEHAAMRAVPEWHVQQIKRMLAGHNITSFDQLQYFVSGADIFGTESDGGTISQTYSGLGMTMTCAETDRLNGWGEIARRLGDMDNGRPPTFYVHRSCKLFIEQIAYLEHDPNKPDDVLKVDANDEGNGGDDAADCARYGLASYKATREVRSAAPMGFGTFAGSSL
jgi:phage terminase large subunit